ncbi:uncharacterized protein C8A04DRAFT_29797 [Dichotomopilus funicola]|uniref:Uncharacterized protein n=1 Tax=Dichotomopilus funicola TaxID=1934379 RepID=A0AAN6ZLQ9_9PEZI|nr:hypothetical protein C8A04DRAFT_29797 [Dichotomopilus funicola]
MCCRYTDYHLCGHPYRDRNLHTTRLVPCSHYNPSHACHRRLPVHAERGYTYDLVCPSCYDGGIGVGSKHVRWADLGSSSSSSLGSRTGLWYRPSPSSSGLGSSGSGSWSSLGTFGSGSWYRSSSSSSRSSRSPAQTRTSKLDVNFDWDWDRGRSRYRSGTGRDRNRERDGLDVKVRWSPHHDKDDDYDITASYSRDGTRWWDCGLETSWRSKSWSGSRPRSYGGKGATRLGDWDWDWDGGDSWGAKVRYRSRWL